MTATDSTHSTPAGTSDRDALILKHMGLADKIAARVFRNTPRCVRLEEIKSAAYFGLLDAASRYEESKNDRFEHYARHRIQGEIKDYLRQCTWGGRARPVYGWSLDVPVFGGRSRRPISLNEGLAAGVAEATDGHEMFTALIRGLPERIRNMFRMYYIDGLTMKAIAERMGMSESRVSQMFTHYRTELKDTWERREYELWAAVEPRFSPESFRLTKSVDSSKVPSA
jgi:RNA polymerase sigma factor (sigma-70 family)